jgi:hypothetical protein
MVWGLPSRKVVSFYLLLRDDGLRALGIYGIPCDCGQVFIGHTGYSIETRVKDQHNHIQECELEKSAMAEHTVNLHHCGVSSNTGSWPRNSDNRGQLIREVVSS